MASGQSLNLSPTFAGSATALQASQVGGNSVALASAGPAAGSGGQRENFLPDAAPIPGISAHQLYAVTQGAGARNHSQSSLVWLDARLGTHRVTAQWVQTEAVATAEFFDVPTSGKCMFNALTVDGRPVAVTGQANQTIMFPDGYLIINEQSGSSSRHFGTLTVNGLHLMVDGEGSMIAASATAQVINAPTPNVAQ